jgi:leader peptidase (prepilin peptidase)/N-methyltransferase
MTPPRPLLYATLAAAYAATLVFAFVTEPSDRLVFAAVIALPLIWLTVTDLTRQEIPDTACAIIALSGLVFQWHLHGLTTAFLATLATAAGLTAAFWLLGGWYFRRRGVEGLGIGDAKLIGAGAICVGASQAWAMILVAATGGIVAALMARRRGRADTGLAFGPFLAYAIFIFVNFPLTGPFAP